LAGKLIDIHNTWRLERNTFRVKRSYYCLQGPKPLEFLAPKRLGWRYIDIDG
jgi:hypothetical protein